MSSPPFMPLYVGDYLADTTHLTTTEHGAYLMLLFCMWRSGGSLPANPAKLAKLCKLTRAQWDRMSETLLAFFDIENGEMTQRRLTRELTRHTEAVRQRRVAASKGGHAKALKNKEAALATGSFPLCQPEPEPELIKKKEERGPRKSRRCPPNFEFDDSVFDTGEKAGLTADQIEQELTKLEDYEFKTVRSDWNAVARNWLRSAKPTKPKGPQIDYAAMERRHQQWKRQQAEAENIAADGGWGEVPI